MIGSGLMRTRMRVRSRTIATSATGQALAPIESTFVDLVGHVVTSKRQDSLINRGEAAVDEIEIVIPWYPNILTGFVVQVFDIVGGSTVQTNYEVMEVIDDRNKHRQLRLRCKVGERSVSAGTYAVELILVAGGGGGGGTTGNQYGGGGGGGGGVTTATLQFATGQTYAVVIGSGGAGASGTSAGADGTATTFPGVTTAVGGGGGGSGALTANKNGRNGGSGGGAGGFAANGVGGAPTATQGSAGGNGQLPDVGPYRGAGGGGAANSGANGNGASGIGGDGLGPFGGIVQFGAGGGGGTMGSNVFATGGLGGGGNGGRSASPNGDNGTTNSGGGGGGAGGIGSGTAASTGGTGGSGIVFLRYLGSSAVITYSGSQTVNISGGYVTHSLLTSGTVTA